MKFFNPRRPKTRPFNKFKTKITTTTKKKQFPIGPYKHETTSP